MAPPPTPPNNPNNTLSSLPAHILRSLEKICSNTKMRDCANAEMSENLNEHGGYNRDQGSLEEQQRTTQSWLLRIDLNRFSAFAYT